MASVPYTERVTENLRARHGALFAQIRTPSLDEPARQDRDLLDLVRDRSVLVQRVTTESVAAQPDTCDRAIALLTQWISQRADVRIIGARVARMAAAVPARRLFATGAHVHMQDGGLPMPHPLRGGGVIALVTEDASAMVRDLLVRVRQRNRDVRILAIGVDPTDKVAEVSNIFVRVTDIAADPARNDTAAGLQEHCIAQLLDAFLIFTGQTLGYTKLRWRLGYEEYEAVPDSEVDAP